MDDSRFDRLTRRLASRRSTVGLLVGGLLAVATESTPGLARRRASGKHRNDRAGRLRAGPTCGKAKAACSTSGDCCNPLTCANGVCVKPASGGNTCASGELKCGKGCCSAPRNGAATCRKSRCGFSCDNGYAKCGTDCVDTRSDADNCGACGNVCSSGEVCSGETCTETCSADLQTDVNNCGACGNSCGIDHTCSDGQCSCSGTVCNGSCIDTWTDPDNCGECGNVCDLPHATATCRGGACVIVSCDSGYKDCDGESDNGCETDIAADPKNCGGCGNTCPETQFCREFQPGCGGQYNCCQPNGGVCFNACDCCSAVTGGGCAFFDGGQNPGTCI
jgi:hypothetical protein